MIVLQNMKKKKKNYTFILQIPLKTRNKARFYNIKWPSDLFKRDCIFCGILTQKKLKITFFCGVLILEKLKTV